MTTSLRCQHLEFVPMKVGHCQQCNYGAQRHVERRRRNWVGSRCEVAQQAHQYWDLGCSRVEDITHSLIVGMDKTPHMSRNNNWEQFFIGYWVSGLRGSPWAADPVLVEVRTKTRNPTQPAFTCKQEHVWLCLWWLQSLILSWLFCSSHWVLNCIEIWS